MIIRFSRNVFIQAAGVIWNSRLGIFSYTLIATLAYVQYALHANFGYWMPHIPVLPVTILGGALAIFLGFRNNSAYDRWWEARKIWGAIVNNSRTLTMYLHSFASETHSDGKQSEEEIAEWRKSIVYRHIGWLYTLAGQLRGKDYSEYSDKYISEKDKNTIENKANQATQLLNLQGLELREGFDKKYIDTFRHVELSTVIRSFYDDQGKSERINNTIFPYYYNYFTRIFLWIFIFLLPVSLVDEMGVLTIPMSIAISFVFFILEKSGSVTEDPFMARAADTPLLTISRTIEIDMLEVLGETDVPPKLPPRSARFQVLYQE